MNYGNSDYNNPVTVVMIIMMLCSQCLTDTVTVYFIMWDLGTAATVIQQLMGIQKINGCRINYCPRRARKKEVSGKIESR